MFVSTISNLTTTVPTLTAKFGFEVILRIINNPANYLPHIMIFSVVIIAITTATAYGIMKIYTKYCPERVLTKL